MQVVGHGVMPDVHSVWTHARNRRFRNCRDAFGAMYVHSMQHCTVVHLYSFKKLTTVLGT